MRDRLLVAAILRPSAKSDEEAVELADELIHFEEQHNPRQVREAREARKREALSVQAELDQAMKSPAVEPPAPIEPNPRQVREAREARKRRAKAE